MKKEQEEHLERIKTEFVKMVDAKYRTGAEEHGTILLEEPTVLDMAIEEAIDQVTYLLTLKEQRTEEYERGFADGFKKAIGMR